MKLIRFAPGIVAIVFILHTPVMSDMYKIDNPAEKIVNPADKIYNPASQIKNPASNIYNPAGRMNAPNPLSPPTQVEPEPTGTKVVPGTKQPLLKSKARIPQKRYGYKTVGAYIVAIKKAFNKDDYVEFIALTEDALRRISAGTLKASNKTKQKLAKYKIFGYGLLEKNEK